MCKEFFCHQCRRHKDVALKSTRKAGSSFYCTACEETLAKLFAPKVGVTSAGEVFSIANEHVRTSRILTANKRAADTVRWLDTHCPA
jgi:hypothetical protein